MCDGLCFGWFHRNLIRWVVFWMLCVSKGWVNKNLILSTHQILGCGAGVLFVLEHTFKRIFAGGVDVFFLYTSLGSNKENACGPFPENGGAPGVLFI